MSKTGKMEELKTFLDAVSVVVLSVAPLVQGVFDDGKKKSTKKKPSEKDKKKAIAYKQSKKQSNQVSK